MPSDDEVVFSSHEIWLAVPSDADDTAWDELTSKFDQFAAEVSAFLVWIRCLTSQDQIPSSPVSSGVSRLAVDVLETPAFPERPVTPNGSVVGALLNSCATESVALEAVRRVAAGETVPVYHHLFLDALSAFHASDFRQCLLYAAIATQALAAGCFEQEYRARFSGDVGSDVRIREFLQAGGTVVPKDPVYEALPARTEFSALLHERPLYLMGKSLLIDHPETYRRANALYRWEQDRASWRAKQGRCSARLLAEQG